MPDEAPERSLSPFPTPRATAAEAVASSVSVSTRVTSPRKRGDARDLLSPPSPSPSRRPGSVKSASGSSLATIGSSGSNLTAGLVSPVRPSSAMSRRSRKGKERADVAELGAVGVGQVSTTTSSRDARQGLRELVAQGQEQGPSHTHSRERASSRASARDIHIATTEPERTYHPRQYYVLTNAGKPVFSLNHDGDNLTNMMGVVQALISIFAEDDDRLRSIVKGKTRITFLLKPELYLFAVSDWGEPEHVMRMHLEYINLQILSVVTATQLTRAFQRRSNFDLSRLLEGSEKFLHRLVEQCQDDLSFLTTTLQVLRLNPALRDTAAAALMPPAKFNDLLYVLLIAGGRIVTLLRPRRHAIHPSDMHLLLNTLATSAALREVETWLPICLPKFNPNGFVHAYISYVREDVGLIFISADKDAFEALCGWRETVVETLTRDGALDRIEESIAAHPYTVAEVGSPGLRHFVYKSRSMTQLTSPEWDESYDEAARARLVTMYQRAQDMLYARPGSGIPQPLKLVYLSGPHEAVLGWLTRPFELYVAVSPLLPMSAVVATANRVAKWVSGEESRLFLRDAPVF